MSSQQRRGIGVLRAGAQLQFADLRQQQRMQRLDAGGGGAKVDAHDRRRMACRGCRIAGVGGGGICHKGRQQDLPIIGFWLGAVA